MRRVPAALTFALVAGALTGAAQSVLVTYRLLSSETAIAIEMCVFGLNFVDTGLAFFGAGMLRSNAAPGGPRVLATIATAAAAVVFAVTAFYVVVALPLWGADRATMQQTVTVFAWSGPIASHVLYVSLTALTVRTDRLRTFVAPFAVEAALLFDMPPPLRHAVEIGGRDLATALRLAALVAITACAWWGARCASAPEGTGWAPAGRRLGRAASALAWHLAITFATVPIAMIAWTSASERLDHIASIARIVRLIPAVLAIVSLVQASRADSDGAPRLRLVGAAAVVGTIAIFDAMAFSRAAAHLLGLEVSSGFDLSAAAPMTWLMPALAACALLAFVSALDAIARRGPAGIDPARGWAMGTRIAASSALVVWATRAFDRFSGETPWLVVMFASIGAVAAIASGLAIVRTARAIARTLGEAPTLPAEVAKLFS